MHAALAPLSRPAFRWFALGGTINRLGSAIAPVALAFAVLDVNRSASALGVVLGVRSLANVAFLLFGGVLADRLPRRPVLVSSSLASGVTQAGVTAAIATDTDTLAVLAALSAVNGAAAAFGVPASNAFVPQMLDAESLAPGNALVRLGSNVAAICGTGVAGVLVAAGGPAWGIGIDAGTFLVAAGCFARVSVAPAALRSERTSVFQDLATGWSAFRSREWLWVVVASFVVIGGAYGGAVTVLGPLVADRTFGRSGWGLALAASTVGLVVGGVASLRLRPRRPLVLATLSLLPCAVIPVVLAAAPVTWLVAAALFVAGVGAELFEVIWQTTLQMRVPDHLLARVSSYDMVGSLAAVPLGQVIAGPVASAIGVTATLLGASTLMTLATAATLCSGSVRAPTSAFWRTGHDLQPPGAG